MTLPTTEYSTYYILPHFSRSGKEEGVSTSLDDLPYLQMDDGDNEEEGEDEDFSIDLI